MCSPMGQTISTATSPEHWMYLMQLSGSAKVPSLGQSKSEGALVGPVLQGSPSQSLAPHVTISAVLQPASWS